MLGLTPAQLDQAIARLHRGGWTERQIAVKYGMAPSAIHYAIGRTKGVARKSYNTKMCEGCGNDFIPDVRGQWVCMECREEDGAL
jgi:hypothetical protein